MSALLLGAFLAASALLWLSTFGYLIFLAVLSAVRRRPAAGPPDVLPPIAVVVPTLNEAADIQAKLVDLRRSDYPEDKLHLVIVDGGSSDRTADIVRREAAVDARLELVRLPRASGKADQVRSVLRRLEEDIVAFTDADSRLNPSCLRGLVAEILGNPEVVLAAAAVSPETSYSVERLHWLFVNKLWRLEGEALSCSGLSGVCYALRREHFLSLTPSARAEDMRLGAMACTAGRRVVLSPRARAVELRVPATSREFLSYRRRRGSCYLYELLRAPAGARRAWRLSRAVRIWQMTGLPWLAAYAYSLALSRNQPGAVSSPALVFVLAKYTLLLAVSLFGLKKSPDRQGAQGGEPCRDR